MSIQVEVKLTFPKNNTDAKLVAYLSLRFHDGQRDGFSLLVKSCRLLLDDVGLHYIGWPQEARRAKCFNCTKTNVDNANYCNSCGAQFHEPPLKAWLMNVVESSNRRTYEYILGEVLDELERARRAVP